MIVEEGKAERQSVSSRSSRVDKSIIYNFITTRGYRRRVIGLYLDNKKIEYRYNTSLARYDRYSKRLIVLERDYIRVVREY